MVWSYSRLSAFSQCPYMWYKNYISEEKGKEGSFFSQYGVFMHECLNKYLNGEIDYFDLQSYFKDNYKEKVTKKPTMFGSKAIAQSYYEDALSYIENIEPLTERVLCTEEDINFNYKGEEFVAIIDLLLMNDKKELTIIDHKSFKPKYLKNGDFDKKSREKIEQYKRQLYLYSEAVLNVYGRFPKYIGWNFFRANEVYKIPFDIKEYETTMKWAMETIEAIKKEHLFLPNVDNSFCTMLCDYRYDCEYN